MPAKEGIQEEWVPAFAGTSGSLDQREHSIATKLSQLPEHALLPVGTAPVISSRSILRNDFARVNARDWQ